MAARPQVSGVAALEMPHEFGERPAASTGHCVIESRAGAADFPMSFNAV